MRIVIARPKNTTGGMSDGSLEYSVVEWPKGQPLPPNQTADPKADPYEVPDDTPLSDWKPSPPKAAKEGKD